MSANDLQIHSLIEKERLWLDSAQKYHPSLLKYLWNMGARKRMPTVVPRAAVTVVMSIRKVVWLVETTRYHVVSMNQSALGVNFMGLLPDM